MKYFITWMATKKDFTHDRGEKVTTSESEADKIQHELTAKLQKDIEAGIYTRARIWVFRKAWLFAREEMVIQIDIDDEPPQEAM